MAKALGFGLAASLAKWFSFTKSLVNMNFYRDYARLAKSISAGGNRWDSFKIQLIMIFQVLFLLRSILVNVERNPSEWFHLIWINLGHYLHLPLSVTIQFNMNVPALIYFYWLLYWKNPRMVYFNVLTRIVLDQQDLFAPNSSRIVRRSMMIYFNVIRLFRCSSSKLFFSKQSST